MDGAAACLGKSNEDARIDVKSSVSVSGLFRRILAEGGCANKTGSGTAYVCVGTHGERLEGLDEDRMVLVAKEFVKVTAMRQGKGKTRIIIVKSDIETGESVTIFDTCQANWINFTKGNILGHVNKMLEGTGLTRFESAILAAIMRTSVDPEDVATLHFYEENKRG